MAHRYSIPVELNCEIGATSWEVGVAHPIKLWMDEGDRGLTVKVASPERFMDLTQGVLVSELPAEFVKLLPDNSNQLPKVARMGEIEVLIGYHEFGGPTFRKADPWVLRNDFLALDGSTAALATFLNRYGDWSRGCSTRAEHTQGDPVVVPPLAILKAQGAIKVALTVGADEWFSRYPHESTTFSTRQKFPHFYHQDSFCVDAIRTSIMIDFLRNVKFRICPRLDCGRPFAAERKGKRYCSQYCAHLVSLRKTRKKQQAMRRKGK
jgi:hypothetical protein